MSGATRMLPSAQLKAHGIVSVGLLLICAPGCGSTHVDAPSTAPALQLSAPVAVESIEAECTPPAGWVIDKIDVRTNHAQQVWISPSRHTAYGVIRFKLPFPVGHELALWGFLEEMKRNEGEAKLVGKQWDQEHECLRFVAEGGRYLVRVNLFVRGFRGWAVYAGTRREAPIDEVELHLAEEAREHTALGLAHDAVSK